MAKQREVATKCLITQRACGENGAYCGICPDNPRNKESQFEAGWQTCPKCSGRGVVDDYLMGTLIKCEVCAGKMIINIKTGQPPV